MLISSITIFVDIENQAVGVIFLIVGALMNQHAYKKMNLGARAILAVKTLGGGTGSRYKVSTCYIFVSFHIVIVLFKTYNVYQLLRRFAAKMTQTLIASLLISQNRKCLISSIIFTTLPTQKNI